MKNMMKTYETEYGIGKPGVSQGRIREILIQEGLIHKVVRLQLFFIKE